MSKITPNVLVCSAMTHQSLWEIKMLFHSVRKRYGNNVAIIWLANDNMTTQSAPAFQACTEVAQEYQVEFHAYEDTRERRNYLSSIRPWMLAKYFNEHPEKQHGHYFYCDSDVWVNEIPEVDKRDTCMYGTDVSAYARLGIYCHENYQAIRDIAGKRLADQLANKIPGVQWIFSNPTTELFETLYQTSEEVFDRLSKIDVEEVKKSEKLFADPWFADIWATPIAMRKCGFEFAVHEGLSCALADDPYDQFDTCAVFHNSGSSDRESLMRGIFSKRTWLILSPLGRAHVLDKHYSSYRYVEKMQEVNPETRIFDIEMPWVSYSHLWRSGEKREQDMNPYRGYVESLEG